LLHGVKFNYFNYITGGYMTFTRTYSPMCSPG